MKKKVSMLLSVVLVLFFAINIYADSTIIKDVDFQKSKEDINTVVDNAAPNVGFALARKKMIDVIVLTDYTGSNVSNLATQLNSLRNSLSANNVDLQYSIIDGTNKAYVGEVLASSSPVAIWHVEGRYEDYTRFIGLNQDLTIRENSNFISGLSDIKLVRTNGVKDKAERFAITTDGYMYGWGDAIERTVLIPTEYDQKSISTPTLYTDISDVKDFAPSRWYGLALKNDGTLWYTGIFHHGPINFPAGSPYLHYNFQKLSEYSNIKQIVATGKFMLALDEDGTVWGEGDNVSYSLGNVDCTGLNDGYGVIYWKVGKVQIAGLTDVERIFGYNRTAYAIKKDGSVWTWGECVDRWGICGIMGDTKSKPYNSSGSTYDNRCFSNPVQIPGLDGKSIANIAVVMNCYGETLYTLVLKKDGTVWEIDFDGIKQKTHTKDGSIQLSDIIYVESKHGSTVYLKKDGTLIAETYQPSSRYNSVISEVVGTGFGGVIPVYGTDINRVYEKALRKGSDRYLLCISKSAGNNYSGGFGSYYSFGTLNNSFVEYLGRNDFSIYAAVPSSTFDYISDVGKQEVSIHHLVNSSVREGKLYDISQLSTMLNYINTKYANVNPESKITQYVVVNEDKVEYSTFYDDGSKDPIYTGEWQYTHDPTVFENDNGIISFSGQWRSTPLLTFTNVGKYDVVYRATDNPKNNIIFSAYRKSGDTPKMTIYAHRRPIAQANVNFTGIDGSGKYITSTVSTSYDLDHTSRTDKGIVQENWAWKDIADAGWTPGKLPGLLPPNKTYLVRLSVMDLEGAWSDPYVLAVKTQLSNQPPTVDASPTSRDWGNTNVTCTVTASDINGDYAYTNYMWSTSPVKPTSGWTKNTSSSFNVTQSTQGSWYLHMEAFDAVGNRFYRMRGPYNIDKTPPSGVFNPNTHSWTNKDVSVTFDPSDTGGSGVKQWRYRICTNNGSTYGSWSGYITGDTNGTITLSTTGLNRIQAEVQDNAGNIGTVTSGTYYIDKIAPTVNASPATLTSFDPINVVVTATDTGGSGIKQTNYQWTKTTAKPASGWLTTTASSFSTTLSDDSSEFYLHVEAFDNAGNSTYRMFGPYKYESLRITDVTISGYWNHWRGQVDMFGERMTNEPHRFLGLERVKINVHTSGYADRVEIRFSSELEAMQFRDSKGNIYDYYVSGK